MEYIKCLVELDEVLNRLSEKELKKIPEDIRKSIKKKKDKTYIWKYDNSKELKEQSLDRKTIAMLAYLNMEYLVNNEQKELLKEMHMFNEKKIENEKRNKYRSEDLFNNKTEKKGISALVEIKEKKWYEKVFTYLRNKFSKLASRK